MWSRSILWHAMSTGTLIGADAQEKPLPYLPCSFSSAILPLTETLSTAMAAAELR
jgi:hypothetical protein